ncbi:MAG: hypothetical protein ACLGPL_00715 [Acidobacteriota bacterium]
MLLDPKAIWEELKEAGYDPVRSAIHESGHAVIALRSCFDIQEITILPDLERGTFGSIVVDSMLGSCRRLLEMVEPPPFEAMHYLKRYIAYVLGGAAAEYLQYGHLSEVCDEDLEEARVLAKECFPAECEASGLLPYFKEACDLLASPDVWGKLESLRDALLEKPHGMSMEEIADALFGSERRVEPPGPKIAEETGENGQITAVLRDFCKFSA